MSLLQLNSQRLDHTRHTTVGTNPPDEGSARFRDLFLTTHKNQKRQTSILPVGFEPPILASERPQTLALDCSANGTDNLQRLPDL
jgi:hypothetical protein